MSWVELTFIYIGLLLVLLAFGNWIAFGLGATGIIGLFFLGDFRAFQTVGIISWNSINSFELTALPLFIFMGDIVFSCNLSGKFYKAAAVWFNRLPGGFLQTNIFSCAAFSAISGSSLATAAAIGSVSYFELIERGYDKRMTLGSLGAGGALGNLIPPSIVLLVYGAMVQESVAKLFIASIVPGIIATVIFMLYIAVRTTFDKKLVPPVTVRPSAKDYLDGLLGMVPFTVLIVIILGGIYAGIMTPTEAAAVSVTASIIMALLDKSLTWERVKIALKSTVKTSCMIFFIVIGAQLLSYLIVKSGISRSLTEWVVMMNFSKYLFLTVVILLYFILGCLLDGLSMVYLTVPILWPMVNAMGFSALWFGILLCAMTEIAMITPPVGMNLFVLKGIAGNTCTFTDVFKGCYPYVILYMIVVLLMIFFPETVYWLPSTMK